MRFPDDVWLDRSARRDDPAAWSARSADGMVASAHYRATEAGAEILAAGGNAFDAAVATSLALSVCEPAGSGLGGMAMVVLHDARTGRTVALDGACPAPRRATPEAVKASRRYRGYRAVALPTHPATIGRLVERFATLPLADLAAPAIRLARSGVPTTALQAALVERYRKALLRESAGAEFLDPDGTPSPAGTVRPRPALAETLERLARDGMEEFYRGETADRIVADFEANDGFLGRDDFREIPWPREVAPVEGTFLGRAVRSLPPPGGGGTLLELLARIEECPALLADPDGDAGVVELAEAIRRTREERRRAHRRPRGGGETTHLSVMDRDGNAVAMTQSLERSFGAKVLTPSLGFLYNNYVKTFKVENRRHPHYLRPGARARSNAAPTLLLEEGRPSVAIGSTGSERMISGIAQVLLRLRRQAPYEAAAAPRLHATPDGVVLIEADRFAPSAVAALERQGFTSERLDAWSFHVGGLHLVVRRGAEFIGVAEPRRDGAAAGP
ncbi:MAG: gamma-glutamyltransferase family protein [Planctomycetota bacterium JB042]